ncbi:porin [Pelomonas sp. HMWF004]|nr:porin [Pelomonas sp. HMWF004]
MKKALIALAVLGLTGGAAVAQSSVTLFGILDANARYVKFNGKSLKLLGTDGLNSSRLGVRGVEDLGNGLKAGFWLESAVNPDTGTVDNSRFWGRRATVSLMGEFGEVRLGRAKTSARLHIDDFDPTSTTGLGNVAAVYSTLGSNADTLNRADNMVSYFLPGNLGGVYGSVDIAAGEGSNVNLAPTAANGVTAGGKKLMSGRIGYKQGPINVAVALANTTGVANAKYKLTSIGGAYDLGIVRPSVNYSQTKFLNREQKIWTFAVTAPLGTQGQLWASYTDSKANTGAETTVTGYTRIGDATLIAAGYIHNLSKRTALYTTVARLENKGAGTFQLNSFTLAGMAAGGSQGGVDVGIRHSF